MKRMLFGAMVAVALLAAACGGGDKKQSQSVAPTQSVATEAAAPTSVASSTPAARVTKTPASNDKKAASGVFSSLFGSALSGGGGTSGLGEGDPALKNYLPGASDLPAGYTSSGEFTFRTPDGISSSGGIDIAASMAFSGDITSRDPSKLGILMTMAMKPDDLQALGDAFSQFKNLSQQDLADALGQGAGQGLNIKDMRVLDADGLGDGAAGFQITMDLGALSGAFGGATGGAGAAVPSSMTMRMYMFARGNYAGAVIRMSFADGLSNDVDELALAHIIDNKLKSAP